VGKDSSFVRLYKGGVFYGTSNSVNCEDHQHVQDEKHCRKEDVECVSDSPIVKDRRPPRGYHDYQEADLGVIESLLVSRHFSLHFLK